MFPPPTTTATSTPSAWTSRNWDARRFVASEEMPNSALWGAKASPDSPLSRELARELGISHAVEVLEASAGTMPMTFGIVRPAVFLPCDAAGWSEERRRVVADFKTGLLRVLCNCEVLTTGFDAPRVTHVVMARPTVSRVLYEQMVGRGLRGPVFGGTEECTIIDCEDNYRSERPTLGYQAFRHIWSPAERKT